MKRSDGFPIEPLSETTWSRIEARTFAELDSANDADDPARRSGRRPWQRRSLMAGAGFLLAAAAAFALFRVVPAGQRAPEALRLVAQDQATTTLVDDISIRLEPASALVVTDHAGSRSLVVLERGTAQFAVAPRAGRSAFVVQAGDVRVEVVGTRFRVVRVGDSARVDTYEGSVRVVSAGRSTLVRRGQSWPDAQRAGREPDEAGGAQEASAKASAPTKSTTRAAESSQQLSAAAASKPRKHQPSRDAAQSGPLDPDGRIRQQFEQAAKLEAAAPERALRIYRQLTKAGGAWQANATYAMGRLEMDRGHHARALIILQGYLERFPNGANASDARALIERSTVQSPVHSD